MSYYTSKLRLPLDTFRLGLHLGSMPGVNPLGDAIRSVLDRYKQLQANREKIAMEGALAKAKTMAEFKILKDIVGEGFEPQEFSVSGIKFKRRRITAEDAKRMIKQQIEKKVEV